jgi:hypothetical protein
MPERIQRKRSKGWTMPEGAIYVGRPGKWGNPFEVVKSTGRFLVFDRRTTEGYLSAHEDKDAAHRQAVVDWILDLKKHPLSLAVTGVMASELRGHDLACWCPVGTPCHADVILELVNA